MQVLPGVVLPQNPTRLRGVPLQVRAVQTIHLEAEVRAAAGRVGAGREGKRGLSFLFLHATNPSVTAHGRMAELVYATDLNSVASRHVGSIPTSATNKNALTGVRFCFHGPDILYGVV